MQIDTIETFAIVLGIVLLIVFIDDRRGKKATELNNLGLCAKCKEPLGIVSESILVSGGGRGGGKSAYVCHKCASRDRLIFCIVMMFIVIAVLVLTVNKLVLK